MSSGTAAPRESRAGQLHQHQRRRTAALGNRGAGVRIEEAPDNTVGGMASNMGNVISGTEGEWPIGGRGRNVWINGDTATGNLVAGNFIGTNAAGDGVVQSTGDGVELHGKFGTLSAALRRGPQYHLGEPLRRCQHLRPQEYRGGQLHRHRCDRDQSHSQRVLRGAAPRRQ